MKKGKELSAQTKMLLAVVVALAFAAVYYFVVFKGFNDKESRLKSEISAVQSEIEVAQAELASINARKEAIEEGKKLGSTVEPYDNSNTEWAILSEYLKKYSSTFGLSFAEPKENGDYYLRNVTVQFTAPELASARSALDSIADCDFRNLVKELTLTALPEDGGLNGGGTVTGTFRITFIESKP